MGSLAPPVITHKGTPSDNASWTKPMSMMLRWTVLATQVGAIDPFWDCGKGGGDQPPAISHKIRIY